MKKILFVCLGNICRSPMAEAVMNSLIIKEDNIKVSSSGTAGYHNGEKAHYKTLQKLKENNIDGSYLISSQLKKDDYLNYDYIIAMDDNNLKDIYKVFNKSKEELKEKVIIKKLLANDVPDPWYTGDFQETYNLCLDGCKKLLEEIRKENIKGR